MKYSRILALAAVAVMAAPAQWRRVEPDKPAAGPPSEAPAPAARQQPGPVEDLGQETVIRLDVNLVNITCSVRDRQGRLVPGLTKDDFIIKEDGKEQTIKNFARETDLPLTMGLLVDVSPSQERLIEVEKEAATRFFQSVLKKKDLAFLISFGSEAELLQDLTSSPRLLAEGLGGLRVNASVGGLDSGPVPTMNHPRGTVLYDAVYLAARERLRNQVGRKALILITDGVDQGSRVTVDEALRAAHMTDAVVYAIDYYDPRAYAGYGGFGGDDRGLWRIVEQTGGRVFKVSKKHPLPEIFDQLQEELRTQYSLSYTPPQSDKNGDFHRIDVGVKQKGMKVQARRGYFSRGGSAATN